MKRFFFLSLLIVCPLFAGAQTQPNPCDIKQRIEANGALLYYMDPVCFYWTTNKSLYGAIITDKDQYFLTLLPHPFPRKEEKKAVSKDDISILLSNNHSLTFSFYDSYYLNDSTFIMMYLIDKKHMDELRKNDVKKISIQVSKEESIRSYQLKLHKAAFRNQLNCFFREQP